MIPAENITNIIYLIRGHKILLNRDPADLYTAETRTLKQAVRRNIQRFRDDFMFVLSKGNCGYPPMPFTEQRVAMLSTHKELS